PAGAARQPHHCRRGGRHQGAAVPHSGTESRGCPATPGRADSQRWQGGKGPAPDQADAWLEKAASGRQEPAGCDQGWAGEGGVLRRRGRRGNAENKSVPVSLLFLTPVEHDGWIKPNREAVSDLNTVVDNRHTLSSCYAGRSEEHTSELQS